MSPQLFNVYMDAEIKVKMVMGQRGESDFLVSCMSMTWLCVVHQRRT